MTLFQPGDKVLGRVSGYKGWHPGVVTQAQDFASNTALAHSKRHFARCAVDPHFVLIQFYSDSSFAFYDTTEPDVLLPLDFKSKVALECGDVIAMERARLSPAGQTTTTAYQPLELRHLRCPAWSPGRSSRHHSKTPSPPPFLSNTTTTKKKKRSDFQPNLTENASRKKRKLDLRHLQGLPTPRPDLTEVFKVSDKLCVRRLRASDRGIFSAEQILKSTFRISLKELRDFYPRHEIFALWYQDRMASATLISVHPEISVLNIVFFATLGYLSRLHFGTVLDHFVRWYAIQRHCSTVIVTAMPLSVVFWTQMGYTSFTSTDAFTEAYVAAGAVRLQNTLLLKQAPNAASVESDLRQAGADADVLLVNRAESSVRSTIALRVLAKHSSASTSSSSGLFSSSSRPPPVKPQVVRRRAVLPEHRYNRKSQVHTHIPRKIKTEQENGVASRQNRAAKRSALREYRQALFRQYFLQQQVLRQQRTISNVQENMSPKPNSLATPQPRLGTHTYSNAPVTSSTTSVETSTQLRAISSKRDHALGIAVAPVATSVVQKTQTSVIRSSPRSSSSITIPNRKVPHSSATLISSPNQNGAISTLHPSNHAVSSFKKSSVKAVLDVKIQQGLRFFRVEREQSNSRSHTISSPPNSDWEPYDSFSKADQQLLDRFFATSCPNGSSIKLRSAR